MHVKNALSPLLSGRDSDLYTDIEGKHLFPVTGDCPFPLSIFEMALLQKATITWPRITRHGRTKRVDAPRKLRIFWDQKRPSFLNC